MKKLHKETEELIQEIKNDNMEAFDCLVLNYRESAVRFALRYTGDYHKAEDIVQEAFAKFYLNLDNYTPQGSFSSYLFKIIRNLSIDYYRKEDRMEIQKLTRDILEDDNQPEEILLAREKEGLLNRMLSKLNENYRTALYLQHYEDMSYSQIAETLELSPGQVRMFIYRGKKKLKKMLEEEVDHDWE